MVLNLSENQKEILKIAISNYPLSTKTEHLSTINPSKDILTKEIRVLIEKGLIIEYKEVSITDTTITAFLLNPECALFLKSDYSTKPDNIKEINDFFKSEYDSICNKNIEKILQNGLKKDRVRKIYKPGVLISFAIFILSFIAYFIVSSGLYITTTLNGNMFNSLSIFFLLLSFTLILFFVKSFSKVSTETQKDLFFSYFYWIAYQLDQFTKNRLDVKKLSSISKNLDRLKDILESEGGSASPDEKLRELFVNRGFEFDQRFHDFLELLRFAVKDYFIVTFPSDIREITLITRSYQLKKIGKFIEDEKFIAGITFLEKDIGVKIKKKEGLEKQVIKVLTSLLKIKKHVIIGLIGVIIINVSFLFVLIKLQLVDTSIRPGVVETLLVIPSFLAESYILYSIIIKIIPDKILETPYIDPKKR